MKQRGNFSGTFGFIMSAAASAVGLGNIWRFPYLAAKDNGGVFILFYIILALTFGFTLLTTEISIGRKTAQSPLTAYGKLHPKWKGIGVLASVVPAIILPYYCVIGGWVVKYLVSSFAGKVPEMAEDPYFTGFITQNVSPVVFMLIFFAATAAVVFAGVDKGIENLSKFLMPALLVMIIGIAIYSITLKYTDESGEVRTGLQGLAIYLIPDFSGMQLRDYASVLADALGQLFYSVSVAMGIMITYGSYVKKETDIMSSINRIEIFDTAVALIAGMMIVPAVYTFMGRDGMSAGPGLMFVSLPKIFNDIGAFGHILCAVFFIMVSFAALTSSVSIMEALVSGIMDKFGTSRIKGAVMVCVYTVITGTIVCLGYNRLYFEAALPNGSVGQILDIMDYLSNNILMPLVALLTCILIGWVVKPDVIIEEVCEGGHKFRRKTLYIVMVKFIAPVLLLFLFLQSLGIIKL